MFLEAATSWIEMKLTSENEAITRLTAQLCQLRNQYPSLENIVEDFVTFHNGNSGHDTSIGLSRECDIRSVNMSNVT